MTTARIEPMTQCRDILVIYIYTITIKPLDLSMVILQYTLTTLLCCTATTWSQIITHQSILIIIIVIHHYHHMSTTTVNDTNDAPPPPSLPLPGGVAGSQYNDKQQ